MSASGRMHIDFHAHRLRCAWEGMHIEVDVHGKADRQKELLTIETESRLGTHSGIKNSVRNSARGTNRGTQ
jgi:hypothetical protein